VGIAERGEEVSNGFQPQSDAELFKPIKVLNYVWVIHSLVEVKGKVDYSKAMLTVLSLLIQSVEQILRMNDDFSSLLKVGYSKMKKGRQRKLLPAPFY